MNLLSSDAMFGKHSFVCGYQIIQTDEHSANKEVIPEILCYFVINNFTEWYCEIKFLYL